jgi:glycopeptide antibiotics resistance protein
MRWSGGDEGGNRAPTRVGQDVGVTSLLTPRRARLWLAVSLALALALTLAPVPADTRPPIVVPLTGIRLAFEQGGFTFGMLQVVGNLLLLAPVGVLLPRALRGVDLLHVLIAALVLSLAIELTQWWMDAGRQPDIDDVWLNTLGAALGWWLGRRRAGWD